MNKCCVTNVEVRQGVMSLCIINLYIKGCTRRLKAETKGTGVTHIANFGPRQPSDF